MTAAWTLVVGERQNLLLVEEVLEEGKDPLAGGRVARDGEDDARRQRPE